MPNINYIACSKFEEDIPFYAKGETPEIALEKFKKDGFLTHCEHYNETPNTFVEVKVFTSHTKGDPEYDSSFINEDYDWILGQEVLS